MLEAGQEVRFGMWDAKEVDVINRVNFLTAKRMVYLANLSMRDYIRKSNKWYASLSAPLLLSLFVRGFQGLCLNVFRCWCTSNAFLPRTGSSLLPRKLAVFVLRRRQGGFFFFVFVPCFVLLLLLVVWAPLCSGCLSLPSG